MQQPWSIYLLAIFMLGLDSKLVGQAFQPEFSEPLMNLTVPIGRDATFRCLVLNLGGYRVGWVKADTKAIQAIHVHVITNNHRVGVSHNGQTVWNLHIRNVQEEDRGQYMCQINTDPMKSQMGHLEVVIPPDFIPEETSGDVMVPEGGTARVSCRARGMPTPRIMWRREDGTDIVIRDPSGGKTKAQVYEEEVLILNKISRSDMGAYLCIASNGIPPSVSKRITIKSRMALTVRRLSAADVGGYRCVAKNSLGPDNQFGSAERPDDEDERESATESEKQANKLQVNSTRNRTSYSPTISIHEQKVSNKVRKIINKFEIDGELGANSNFVSCSILLVYIPSVVFKIVIDEKVPLT
ncbi:Uncharacterized protein OBRU01_06952 [Operophtera brumata]|uniref:Ig-like domain-containing protein n=1 Tax=Operophtera brumata TaxID=104452 RepID=A0A0L7LKE7_OPEBR|nr:Uncharacterized protein OBRU01_06952 [Operophtera brumata]